MIGNLFLRQFYKFLPIPVLKIMVVDLCKNTSLYHVYLQEKGSFIHIFKKPVVYGTTYKSNANVSHENNLSPVNLFKPICSAQTTIPLNNENNYVSLTRKQCVAVFGLRGRIASLISPNSNKLTARDIVNLNAEFVEG